MRPLAAAVVLVLSGCASSTVVLLDNEGGRPPGALALIDPKTGEDVRLVDTTGNRVVVAGSRSHMRALKPGVSENRYKALLGYLPEPPVRFILYFPNSSIEPSPESIPTRTALFAEIKRRGDGVDVQIEGHTDRVGDAADNDRLSLERAVAARDMLLGFGLSQNITRIVGRGERDPMPGHATADGVEDPVNRRVEVVVR